MLNKGALVDFLKKRLAHYGGISKPHGVGFSEGCVEAFEEIIEEIQSGVFDVEDSKQQEINRLKYHNQQMESILGVAIQENKKNGKRGQASR